MTIDDTPFIRDVILAEARTLESLARTVGPEVARAAGLIEGCASGGGTVLVAGIGKSGLIGRKISATLASLGVPSHTLHPTEAMHGDLGRIRPRDLLLALSHSGETEELVNLAMLMKQDGVAIVSITAGRSGEPSVPGGALARLATVALSLGAIEEASASSVEGGGAGLGGLAPTCSTTATLALGDALALAVARRRSFTADDFARRHPGGALGGQLRSVVEILRFRVGENLPVVDEGASVHDALAQTRGIGRRPGALVVTGAGGAVTGIFTDADLRRLYIDRPEQFERPIREVMTRSPRTLADSALVRDALRMVREYRADEIPVVDDAGRPVGVLDVQDLMSPRIVNPDRD